MSPDRTRLGTPFGHKRPEHPRTGASVKAVDYKARKQPAQEPRFYLLPALAVSRCAQPDTAVPGPDWALCPK